MTISRAIAAAFWLVTAIYALLASIPFASEQFLKPGLSPALVAFARWHAWLSLAALGAAAAGLLPLLRSGHRGVQAFVAAWAAATAAIFVTSPLARLEPSASALTIALLSLVPPVWLSSMDVRAGNDRRPQTDDAGADSTWSDFAACMVAALVVTIWHAVRPAAAVLPLGAGSLAIESTRSLWIHLILFSAMFAAISVVRGAARLMSTRAAVEAWMARAVIASALAIFIFAVLLRPLSMIGIPAMVAAAAFGAAIAMTIGPRGTTARPGLEEALGGVVPSWAARSDVSTGRWLILAGAAIYVLEVRAAAQDWNFALVKTAALASWFLALAATLRVFRIRGGSLAMMPFALCLAVFGCAWVVPDRPMDLAALDAWTSHDPSRRLAGDTLTPRVPVADPGLGDFLQSNTNIARRERVEPVAIDLADLSGPPAGRRPHIFLFVVDSLRRDYVSPYNRGVTFTPAIDRFARDSTVFERAFTRYGATGLSVPAIWVGGLVLHKQYVTPFAPMNTLAKLLDHEQYRQWIGMDNILDVILPPSPSREPIDAGIQVADYRFCRTLDEVRGRLDRLTPDAPPAFVYSLPQDIHVSAITREGAGPIDNGSYGAFYPPYASRVRRLDACFGAFVDDLKARGLFDESIVILTADHGDSLGEQGRMGHAYTIYPEIVQVPLIVHLPARLQAAFVADTSAPAFTTDITPTLYRLLGREPKPPAPFFGRPLFRDRSTPAAPRSTAPDVIASSYGTVYGALLDDARRLYIFDAIALRDYAYEIDGTGAGRADTVREDDRMRGHRAIRATVEAIAQLYHYRW